MSNKYCYRDLSHPSFTEALKGHNYTTLKLVKTVAEFAQRVSLAHEQFANQILNVVDCFKKKNQELKKERGPVETEDDPDHNPNHKRPVECPSSLNNAWETLLQETQYDAQAHADTATLIMKNVYTPLLEIASYKKSQSKKLYSFRENFESMVNTAEDNVYKCHKAYIEAYQNYRRNCNGREAVHYMAQYHNAHNDYVLQIRASNHQEEEYHSTALPYLLEELEEIHIDLANTLNGAVESHALLLLTKANEQSRRFESILKVCKQVNPKNDVHNFVISVSQEPVILEPKHYTFNPPSDPNIPGSELGTLKDHVIFDRHTEHNIKQKRLELQKEAAELTSYLKQNQDVTQTLVNVCQRNLANHLYAKVYETQEDLCRKRNEIRIANLQLAAIRAQIELLTQKQNGSAVDADGAGRQNKTTIKGMWKKAFKSIKTKDKDKDKGDPSGEKSDGKFQSRMSTRQSSLKKALRRKDSKEASDTESQVPEVVNPRRDPGSMDPVFATLRSASYMRKPRSGASSSSETHLESLNESFENDPIVQPGTSDYEDSYGSYSAKK